MNSLNDFLSRVSVPVVERRVQLVAETNHVTPTVQSAHRITLGEFLRNYIEGRTDVKPSTRINFERVEFNLVAYFGHDKILEEVSEGDADEWRLWLAREVRAGSLLIHAKLAESTIRKLCSRARQFFRAAKRKRYIAANPFAEMKRLGGCANEARLFFLTRADSQRVIDTCPTPEWRVIFALARWGGLRCPSEVLSLRWEGIDFANGRMRIDSPKTEHHEGGAYRICPLFPEVRRELEAIHTEGAKSFVINERRRRAAMSPRGWANSNLRTMFEKIVWRSGVKPWPKLFQNLRSTRETELCETFPVHVVCSWIGNSELIARKHYLQTTDQHFAAAAGGQP